jgi:hypothetical protein
VKEAPFELAKTIENPFYSTYIPYEKHNYVKTISSSSSKDNDVKVDTRHDGLNVDYSPQLDRRVKENHV